MPKHIDAVKSFEEFRAPWETESGSDAEIDKAKLKRYIHNLVTDKAKAQDARDEAVEKVEAAEKAAADARAEAEKASPEEANRKIARLEQANESLKSQVKDLTDAKEEADLRNEVLAGLDPKYAKYVVGKTREELEKSLEEVKADFGLGEGAGKEEEEDDEDVVRTRPRTRLINGADPKNGTGGEAEIDFDKVADQVFGSSIFG